MEVKLAWGSVGPSVTTLPAVERLLCSQRLSPELLRRAGTMVAASVAPLDDVRASGAYRRQFADNLLLRIGTQLTGGCYCREGVGDG